MASHFGGADEALKEDKIKPVGGHMGQKLKPLV